MLTPEGCRNRQHRMLKEMAGNRWDLFASGDYRTAWYMCHRIRAAMKDGGFGKLMGEVEIDETFIGGTLKNRHRKDRFQRIAGPAGKIPVVGAIARKGNVVCQIVENVSAQTLERFVKETVSDEVDLVANCPLHSTDG